MFIKNENKCAIFFHCFKFVCVFFCIANLAFLLQCFTVPSNKTNRVHTLKSCEIEELKDGKKVGL